MTVAANPAVASASTLTAPLDLSAWAPACLARSADRPWVPSGTPGKTSKLLRVLPGGSGFVELLRMEPGLAMPLHRHSGDVHVFQLEGQRRLSSGELVGPGDFVHEPPGNTDWWRVEGDEPMLALAVVMGTVDFLGAGGQVLSRASAQTQWDELQRHCQAQGLPCPDLGAGIRSSC